MVIKQRKMSLGAEKNILAYFPDEEYVIWTL